MPVSVGVLSSIPCDKSFKDFLEAEINENVAGANTFQYKDDKNTTPLLSQAVRDFNAGNPVAIDWIITLGGRIAYDSIAAASTAQPPTNAIPFISLLGVVPQNWPNLCHGGVSLESYKHNADRVAYLIQKGFQPNNISLFYSQYSHLAADEVNDWNNVLRPAYPGLGPVVTAFTSASPNAADYAGTVRTIATQSVIVSADPFFHKTKNTLVPLLNGTIVNGINIYVCYPLQNYGNAVPPPAANHATVFGSTLEYAIKVLAAVASLAINNHPINSFIKDPVGKAKDL